MSEQELQELQTQLADVQALLEASPDDPSLLSLQADLQQLIAITTGSTTQPSTEQVPAAPEPVTKVSSAVLEAATAQAVSAAADLDEPSSNVPQPPVSSTSVPTAEGLPATTEASTTTAAAEPTKKKKKSSTSESPFQVPQHLIATDDDTEAERNRKRRTLKALKRKWKEQQKEIVSNKKQKSWQSFQKKKKNKASSKSIFATQDGGDTTKVGVVSGGRQLTAFGERKRHSQHQG